MTRIRWKKASFSAEQTDCVELATDGRTWGAVRDSKRPDGGALVFTADTFRVFVASVQAGQIEV